MLSISVLALAFVTSACGKNNEPPPPSSGVPNAPAETGPKKKGKSPNAVAEHLFGSSCVMCHGASGKGDGQMANGLSPKPRDYSDPAWQASVTDDDIRKIIVQGGAAVGKSAAMPANPGLAQEPEVVDGLVKIIRGVGPAK